MNNHDRIKSLLRVCLLLCMVCMLSGCAHYRINLEVSKSGTVTQKVMAFSTPEVIESLNSNQTIDTILNNLRDQYAARYPDETVTILRITNDDTSEMKQAGVKSVLEDTKEYQVTRKSGKITITIPKQLLYKRFQFIFGQEQNGGTFNGQSYADAGADAILDVKMPYAPTTNVGEVINNSVIIDILQIPDDIDAVVISCDIPRNYVPVGLGGAAVIAGFALAFKRKKAC